MGMVKTVRIRTPEATEALTAQLINHDWKEVNAEDIKDSYAASLETFRLLYNYRRQVSKKQLLETQNISMDG